MTDEGQPVQPAWARDFADLRMTDWTERMHAYMRRAAAERALLEASIDDGYDQDAHYPSSVFDEAINHVIMRWLQVKPVVRPDEVRDDIALDVGIALEDVVFQRWANASLHLQWLRAKRIRLRAAQTGLAFDISGKVDFPMLDPDTGMVVPVELKTMKQWYYVRKDGTKDEEAWKKGVPRKQAVGQLMLYIKAFRDMFPNRAGDYGFLVTTGKNTGQMFPVKVFWSQSLYNAAIDYFRAVEIQAIAGVIPPADLGTMNGYPHTWNTTHCDFYEYEFLHRPLEYRVPVEKTVARLEALARSAGKL